MLTILNKDDIITTSENIFQQFTGYCRNIPDPTFFLQPPDKWSIAQEVQHLTISVHSSTLAYNLPKFIVRLIAGKPNRPSRSYEGLVERYKEKLAAGGKAGGRYIPKPVPFSTGKITLLDKWEKTTQRYLHIFQKHTTNEQLDKYIVPHPLLGKITLRELCYFNIYHTEHHLNSIKAKNKV